MLVPPLMIYECLIEWKILTTPECDDEDVDMLEKFTQLKAADNLEPMASSAVLISIRA